MSGMLEMREMLKGGKVEERVNEMIDEKLRVFESEVEKWMSEIVREIESEFELEWDGDEELIMFGGIVRYDLESEIENMIVNKRFVEVGE